ncbi:MAG: hypothetical protein ABEJ62_01690 [Candidatus Nanohaloarchaea archaeon]
MNWFWTAAAVFIVVAVALVAFPGSSSGITFTDLETECRYDRAETADFTLEDRRLVFEGMFPVDNTDVKLNHGYSKSSGKIVLNVKSSDMSPPRSFVNECLGTVVYDARTRELSPGSYDVRLKHNGDLQKRQVIRVTR